MSTFSDQKLLNRFKDKSAFTREELFDYFRDFEPDLKEETLAWRIYDLKKRGIIQPVKRGVYTSSPKPTYTPQPSDKLGSLARKIQHQFSGIETCMWETQWINEFSRHQAGKNIRIIEIEKEFVESLYYYLNDYFSFDFFVNPDEKVMDYYVSESDEPVVIKQLITRSPTQTRTERNVQIPVPLLEKILVDLYVDKKLFFFYQGGELNTIFERALTTYTLNFTKLFSYARRRGKMDEIKAYIKRHASHLEIKEIFDD